MAVKAKSAEAVVEIPDIAPIDTSIRTFATRYKQGGRTVFSLDLSPLQITNLITAPDPNIKSVGNRQIRLQHAIDFARYVRVTPGWIAPAMILRAPNIFEFELLTEQGDTAFGLLSFPRLASQDIHILDGQHRTLGFHLAARGISEDLEKARNSLALARKNEGPNSKAVADVQATMKNFEGQRVRLDKERISLQIFVEEDTKAYRQMFFDIAENALGITASVKARFDTRKVVNRALEVVLEHPLLLNRVDPEGDRVPRNGPRTPCTGGLS